MAGSRPFWQRPASKRRMAFQMGESSKSCKGGRGFVLAVLFLMIPLACPAHTPPDMDPKQWEKLTREAEQMREEHRRLAVRVNELAGKIRSEADARDFVDETAKLFLSGLPYWFSRSERKRVAKAEFLSISEGRYISEERIATVFNRLMDDIAAGPELRITESEVHTMRAAQILTTRTMWQHPGMQNIWQAPNVHSVTPQGGVAPGCRAVESLKLLYVLLELPSNLGYAREIIKKDVDLDIELQKAPQKLTPGAPAKMEGRLETHGRDPLEAALDEARMAYVRRYGVRAFEDRLKEMFDRIID